MSQTENQEWMNENSTSHADTWSDLPLADEQADRLTGGTGNQGKLIVGIDDVRVR